MKLCCVLMALSLLVVGMLAVLIVNVMMYGGQGGYL